MAKNTKPRIIAASTVGTTVPAMIQRMHIGAGARWLSAVVIVGSDSRRWVELPASPRQEQTASPANLRREAIMALLGIDIGTSGTKTLLIDEDGKVLATASAEYPLSTPKPGWAEQDPEDWWTAVQTTVRAVLAKSGLDAGQVRGVGLSG